MRLAHVLSVEPDELMFLNPGAQHGQNCAGPQISSSAWSGSNALLEQLREHHLDGARARLPCAQAVLERQQARRRDIKRPPTRSQCAASAALGLTGFLI